MGGFMGGSAWAMARDISDGFVNVTDRTFKALTVAEIMKLGHEIERLLRELRGGAVTDEPLPEVQKRQRRIQRLNSARTVMQAHRQRTRR